ncbi:MAG TPA: flagellar basal-body MS-ring/collar protein FliF [Bryobacteraceae bacterium]|jgi:flagellar M-ring protein FliF|nr:flagellar basal-body MS-ring/collar protein FliF [Bryobacteraceae bacterium]
MDQLRKFVDSLGVRQRLTILASAVLLIFGLLAFLHWNRERDFRPLYSNLSAEDAGAVLAKLRESGTEYRVRDADSTILVPSERLAELRLQMATAGIPKSGRIGYELFDRTNLGITDFTEQINYHRAVEGELERSVMAISGVEQARVHVTFPKDSAFTDQQQPAKASVMVKIKPGFKLSQPNAVAITQLVSSAVEGLAPESVSVMDMHANLLLRPKKPGDGSEPSEDLLQYKTSLEHETLAKIGSVLDPLLGSEKYRASVDMDCDLTSGEQSEELFDPTHSVITTSQRSEEGSLSHESAGVPGTQSNLPRPVPRPAGQGGGVARRSENMAYETSRTVRRLKLPQGILRRMSISVLVDQNVRWEMTGKGAAAHAQRIIEPPSPERMKTIQSVVAAAAGFNSARGDQLTVETLPFEATLTAEPPASMSPAAQDHPAPTQRLSPFVLGGTGGAILLLAGVGFFVYRNRRKRKGQRPTMPSELAAAGSSRHVLRESEKSLETPLAGASDVFKLAPMMTTKSQVLTKQVGEEAQKDPAALARVLRSWLNDTAKT